MRIKQRMNTQSSATLNVPTMAWLLTGAAVATVIALVAFGIYYGFRIGKDPPNPVFQQQAQMWVGDNGLIFLITWIFVVSTATLAFLSFREHLPLWLDEFRTWGEFKRIKLGEMIHSWNTIISNPQFSAILGVVNSSLDRV